MYFGIDYEQKFFFSADVESVQINEETVNPKEKIGPEDFELLKVLGKGGYGKVTNQVYVSWGF